MPPPDSSRAVLRLHPSAEGVLPGHLLERAIRAGYVAAGRFNIPTANIQPASLDLRLGEKALRIRCSFLPGEETVERKLKDYILDEIDLRGAGAMLRPVAPISLSSRSVSISRQGCVERPIRRARLVALTFSPASSPTIVIVSMR